MVTQSMILAGNLALANLTYPWLYSHFIPTTKIPNNSGSYLFKKGSSSPWSTVFSPSLSSNKVQTELFIPLLQAQLYTKLPHSSSECQYTSHTFLLLSTGAALPVFAISSKIVRMASWDNFLLISVLLNSGLFCASLMSMVDCLVVFE